MNGPSIRIWIVLLLVDVILSCVRADAQEGSKKGAPNHPYLKGTEGYAKGPRGLTSYMPVAIDQPFAARMAHDVEAKPGIDRAHQAVLRRSAGQVRAQSAGRQSSPRIKFIEELHVHASIQT
jgi:hypothetical protein